MEKPFNDDNRNAVLLAFLSIPVIPVEPSDCWNHPLNMVFVHANVNPSSSEVRGRNSVRRRFPGRGGNAVCHCVKNYETWGAVQCSAGSEDGIGVPEANGPYSLPRDEELDPCLERLCDACRYTMPETEDRSAGRLNADRANGLSIDIQLYGNFCRRTCCSSWLRNSNRRVPNGSVQSRRCMSVSRTDLRSGTWSRRICTVCLGQRGMADLTAIPSSRQTSSDHPAPAF
jgi:hypothetical protein